jgi:hypothetical protein
MGDLDALLERFAIGDLPMPAPPAGAIDPWTGTPILADQTTAPPPLTTPMEIPLPALAPAVPSLEAPADSATTAPEPTTGAAAIVSVAAPITGTPITREEVLELLQEIDATIYLMV